MRGQELFEEVFADEIEEWGEMPFGEIEDLDEVTCYDEHFAGKDGWYYETTISFRYRGKKYAFERYDHSSDNVCDTKYLIESFREVVSTNELDMAIDRIIGKIEDETVGTWEEIVRDLEEIKRKFYYLNE